MSVLLEAGRMAGRGLLTEQVLSLLGLLNPYLWDSDKAARETPPGLSSY